MNIELPRKRKILILINPFSGRRMAAANWIIAKQLLDKSYLDITAIET